MELQRITKQRRMILDELQRTHLHPTAAELYQKVRRRIPRISLGTVYRNLEMLHREGLIRKLNSSGKEARFDGDLSDHYHIRCLRCGRTDDLPGAPNIEVSGEVGQPEGWALEEQRLEFVGLCPDCRAN